MNIVLEIIIIPSSNSFAAVGQDLLIVLIHEKAEQLTQKPLHTQVS